MRARALFSLAGALIAASVLVAASGAGTAKNQRMAKIDVSTRASVVHYLRSVHVKTKGLVIQRGAHNYAGARCPGKAWACAKTRHTVVQIAKRGGVNRFACSTARCTVVQFSGTSHGVYLAGRQLQSTPHTTPNNTAKCVINTSAQIQVQVCVIVQLSSTANNVAVVYEHANGPSGLTQAASINASITQRATGASNSNTACVNQGIAMTGSTSVNKGSVSVSLNAHETATIKQDSAHGGNSASQSATSGGACSAGPLSQTQTETSSAKGPNSITQNENAASNGANVTIDIEQNQSTGFLGTAHGVNSANFEQDNTLTAIANTPAGPVNQTQSSATGGLLGTVNQDSRDPSTIVATQHEIQCEDAATSGLTSCATGAGEADFNGTYALHQTQIGPEGIWKKAGKHGRRRVPYSVHKGVGTATQTGNGADTFQLTQSSKQDNDTGGNGQTNDVKGDCSTDGNCNIAQQTNVDGNQTTNTQSGQNLNSGITCTGSACTPTTPAVPQIVESPPNPSTSTSATFTFTDTTAGVAFLCQIDGGGYSACQSGQTYNGLSYGAHTFSVEAKDSNGNLSNGAASYPWTIVPPVPEIGSTPPNPSNSSSATFTFSDDDSSLSFLCQIDGGGYSPCQSGQTYTGLTDGLHTFSVEATDGSGHVSAPASYPWTVALPAIVFDGSPGTGAPPATLGPYTMTPFGTDTQPSCGAEGSSVTGVNDPAGSISFGEALDHDTVVTGNTGCWQTWSNGYSGDVYSTFDSSGNKTQVTIGLPSGTQAFYFYAEPNQFADFVITATEQGGTTSGPVTVNGQAGATYFGFYGINGATLSSITVSETDPTGFAVGEFGISPAAPPAP